MYGNYIGKEFELSDGKMYKLKKADKNGVEFYRETGNIIIPVEQETWIYEGCLDALDDLIKKQYK